MKNENLHCSLAEVSRYAFARIVILFLYAMLRVPKMQ